MENQLERKEDPLKTKVSSPWLVLDPPSDLIVGFFESRLNSVREGLQQLGARLDSLENVYLSAEENPSNRNPGIGEDVTDTTGQETIKLHMALYEERRNTLTCVQQIEELKLERDEYRRKYEAALVLSGILDSDVLSFFSNDPRARDYMDRMVQNREALHRELGAYKAKKKKPEESAVGMKQRIAKLEAEKMDLLNFHKEQEFLLNQSLEGLRAQQENTAREQNFRLNRAVGMYQTAARVAFLSMKDSTDLSTKVVNLEGDIARCYEFISRHLNGELTFDEIANDDYLRSEYLEVLKANERKPTYNQVLAKCDSSTDVGALRKMHKAKARLEVELDAAKNRERDYELKFLKMKREYNLGACSTDAEMKKMQNNLKKYEERHQLLLKQNEKLALKLRLDESGQHAALNQLQSQLQHLRRLFNQALKNRKLHGDDINNIPEFADVHKGMSICSELLARQKENNPRLPNY